MLREKFDWPKPDLSPLALLSAVSDEKIANKPAPAIRIESWINSQPVDLAKLRGKIVVLHFDDGTSYSRQELAPALRQLYAAYHLAGLEIVSIQPPGVDEQEIRRVIEGYGMEYPVGVDSAAGDMRGTTASAYAAEQLPCAVLIDREGKVHPPGEGGLMGTLVSLLAKAGSRDLPRFSLESPQIPPAAMNLISAFLQEKVSTALAANPKGRVECRIVDDKGQPIAGAKVKASLNVTVLAMARWGAFWGLPYRKPIGRSAAASGSDGQLEIEGLCKGTYTLKAEAPGKAWAERRVIVTPELDPASVEVALMPGLRSPARSEMTRGSRSPARPSRPRNGCISKEPPR